MLPIPNFSTWRWLSVVASGGLTTLALSSCLYDEDKICSKGQILDDFGACLCPPDQLTTPDGCVRCKSHEVPGVDSCECESGYSRTSPQASCEKTPEAEPEPEPMMSGGDSGMSEPEMEMPSAIGKPCTSHADCAGTDATYCDTFVTMGCLVEGCNLANDDCPEAFECCDLSLFGIINPLCLNEGDCMQ